MLFICDLESERQKMKAKVEEAVDMKMKMKMKMIRNGMRDSEVVDFLERIFEYPIIFFSEHFFSQVFFLFYWISDTFDLFTMAKVEHW